MFIASVILLLCSAKVDEHTLLEKMRCAQMPHKMHYRVSISKAGHRNTELEVWSDSINDFVFVKTIQHDAESAEPNRSTLCRNGIRKGYTAFFEGYAERSKRIVHFIKNDDYDPSIGFSNIRWGCIICNLSNPNLLTDTMIKIQTDSISQITSSRDFRIQKSLNTKEETEYIIYRGNDSKYISKRVFDKYQRAVLTETISSNYTEIVTASFDDINPISLPSTVIITRTQPNRGNPTAITYSFSKISDAPFFEPKQFDLEAFDLPDSTLIGFPEIKSPSKYPVWRNNALQNETALDRMKNSLQSTASPATPKPSLISQAWPYFLGFIVFAVIGFWLLRKQRQAAKEG